MRFAWGTGRSQQYTVADKTHSDHVPGTAAAAAAAVVIVVVVAADMAVVEVVVNLFSISKNKRLYTTDLRTSVLLLSVLILILTIYTSKRLLGRQLRLHRDVIFSWLLCISLSLVAIDVVIRSN